MTFPNLPNPAAQYVNEFTYENWPPATTITMYNVPFDDVYRNVINWQVGAVDQRDEYFNSLPGHRIALNNGGRVRPFSPVKIPTPLGIASEYNYIVVRSPATVPGDRPQVYYYFITDLTYVAGNVTLANLQLDVWTTYCDRVEFGNAFVVRGHIGISNANARMTVNGKVSPRQANRYLTIPEGLDAGADYYSNPGTYYNFAGDQAPLVMIQSTAKLTGNLGSLENPSLATASGAITNNVPNGCEVYYVSGVDLARLWEYLSPFPYVSQCIVSQHVVPARFVSNGGTVQIGPVSAMRPRTFPSVNDAVNPGKLSDVAGIEDFVFNYPMARNLLKFHTFPYLAFELTGNSGSATIFKPEYVSDGNTSWHDEDVNLYERSMMVPPSPRIQIGVVGYLAEGREQKTTTTQLLTGGARESYVPTGDELSNSLVLGDFPTFGVANNSALVAIASTSNTRAYQQDTADWSQAKANASSSIAYDQAGMAMATQNSNNASSISGQNRSTSIQNASAQFQGNMGLINSGVGAIGSLASGNVGGALAGAVGMATTAANTSNTISTSNQMNVSNQQTQNEMLSNQQYMSGFNRDTNRDLAQFAAKGDYQNAIAGITARTRDLHLTPPAMVGNFGGDAMNIVTGLWGYTFRHKRITPQAIIMIANVWNRYGYYIQEWMKLNDKLMNMTNFTYWQVQDCSILSTRLPESYKQTIRGIFEKGVTLWRTPELIGRTAPEDNEIVAGVSY